MPFLLLPRPHALGPWPAASAPPRVGLRRAVLQEAQERQEAPQGQQGAPGPPWRPALPLGTPAPPPAARTPSQAPALARYSPGRLAGRRLSADRTQAAAMAVPRRRMRGHVTQGKSAARRRTWPAPFAPRAARTPSRAPAAGHGAPGAGPRAPAAPGRPRGATNPD
ncbi:translation initiation factor IF-2-like [Penaeus chinensis]|uniref:translation initiation factor IF-2-like n=1 Tax=Penaeus chinensis TaxID=139456 RepID=UPI001FB5B5DA|nr:translation initiation factor IF-2-like [Penaeus chinensis]